MCITCLKFLCFCVFDFRFFVFLCCMMMVVMVLMVVMMIMSLLVFQCDFLFVTFFSFCLVYMKWTIISRTRTRVNISILNRKSTCYLADIRISILRISPNAKVNWTRGLYYEILLYIGFRLQSLQSHKSSPLSTTTTVTSFNHNLAT